MFPEEDAALLKAWIVKRLENTSDADADVLADYVLALLRHDGNPESVRKLCEEEIPDFLKEDSSVFVSDVFEAIKYKLYHPGARPPPKQQGALSSAPPPTTTASVSSPVAHQGITPAMPPRNGLGLPQNGSRKRSYHDRGELDAQDINSRDGQFSGAREYKQPRRGGSFGGPRGGRSGPEAHHNHNNNGGGPGMAPPPAPLPFPTSSGSIPVMGHGGAPTMGGGGFGEIDANRALEAMITLQSMGLPMPQLSDFVPPPQQRNSGRQQGQGKKRRCRDFDTKGFCARGSACPWDHGREAYFAVPSRQPNEEYDPSNATILANGTSLQGMPPAPFMTPFEVPVPQTQRSEKPNKKRRAKAAFSADGPNHDRSKTTIVIENIPEESFTEEEVRVFFAEFGNIVEVSMQPYKHLAVVKYDNWHSAQAAYKSPKVIFNNRFVKVFWYKEGTDVPAGSKPSGGKTGTPADTNGSHAEDNNGKAGSPAFEVDMEEFERRMTEAQQQFEEKTRLRQELDRQRQELEERQKELLRRQKAERERLLEKIRQKSSGGDEEMADVEGESGDKDDDGFHITTTSPATPAASGNLHTDALRAQLAALEAEAKSLGIDPDAPMDDAASASSYYGGASSAGGGWRGGYRGRGGHRGYRGGFNPRGGLYRGAFRGGRGGGGISPAVHEAYAAYSLDNRPKKVAVAGVDFTVPEKDEMLRQFLLGLGEFTDIQTTSASAEISFKDRRTAEKFMHSFTASDVGVDDGSLELTWVKNNSGAGGAAAPPSSLSAAAPSGGSNRARSLLSPGTSADKGSTTPGGDVGRPGLSPSPSPSPSAFAAPPAVASSADTGGDGVLAKSALVASVSGAKGPAAGASKGDLAAGRGNLDSSDMDYDVGDENDWGN